MRRKSKKPTNANNRSETVGVTVTPALKSLLKQMADEETRTISSLTYRLLMESPTLKSKLGEAQAV